MEVAETMNTAKEMLAVIVKFLNKNNDESKELYTILSALRGPDHFSNGPYKAATTAVLRHHIGLTTKGIPIGIDINPDNDEQVEIRRKMLTECQDWHFLQHIELAFAAAGLSWERNNNQPSDSPPHDK